jgi:hypothetical protein
VCTLFNTMLRPTILVLSVVVAPCRVMLSFTHTRLDGAVIKNNKYTNVLLAAHAVNKVVSSARRESQAHSLLGRAT